jgi:hypothetical protein
MLRRNDVIKGALRMDSRDRAALAEKLLASLDRLNEAETRSPWLQVPKRYNVPADPVLAELWDNPRDAAYDKL